MNSLLKKFVTDNRGGVTIEFFFMILFLCLIFAFMVDLVLLRSNQGKLDHASYTMVNLLRERKQLAPPNAREGIANSELAQYRQLAKLLVYGDKNSKESVDVVLEYKANDGTRTVLGDSGKCAPYQTLDTLWAVSPYSETSVTGAAGRKVPLYQVTLCMQISSLFKGFTTSEQVRNENGIRSSSMSITR